MLGNPFTRRRKAGGRARFTFGRELPDTQTPDTQTLDPRDGPDAVATAEARHRPDARRRDAETLAGGADRLAEIERFAVSGFLPEAEQARLSTEKTKLDQAIENGPLDDAVAPLREMEKRYAQAKGGAARKPTQPDPFATAHLPYLNQAQLTADMKRPDYGLKGGEANPALHDAIRSKLRKSAFAGQRRLEPIEPPRGENPADAWHGKEAYVDLLPNIVDPSLADIDPEQLIDLLPSPYDPKQAPPKDAARTLEDRPYGTGNPALAQALFGADPLSPDEHARLADDPVAPIDEGVRVAQAEPAMMSDATAGDLAAFGETLRTALRDLGKEDANQTQDLKARALRSMLKQDGLYDGDVDDAEAAAKVVRAMSPEQREAFVVRQVRRSAIAIARGNGYGAALEKTAQETLQGAAAIGDAATAPPTEEKRDDPVWGLDDDLGGRLADLAASSVEAAFTGEPVSSIRARKRLAQSSVAEALKEAPGALYEVVASLPDAPEHMTRWLLKVKERRTDFAEIEAQYQAGDMPIEAYLSALSANAQANAEDAMEALAVTTGLGAVGRQALRRIERMSAERMAEIRRISDEAGFLGMAPMSVDRTRWAKRGELDAFIDRSEPLADFKKRIGKPPILRKGFDKWVDSLTHNDVLRLWDEDKRTWEKIAKRIRGSGKLHEWHMVTMLPDLRRLGVPTEEIRSLDFRTPTRELRVKNPETGKVYTHLEGTSGGTARKVMEKFHLELADAIYAAAEANDLHLLYRKIAEIAEDWLPNGINDLPAGIQRNMSKG